MTTPTPDPLTSVSLMPPLRVAQLGGRKTQHIDLNPDAVQRGRVAALLGLEGVRKFRFQAQLRPLNRSDWELTGHLGATIVQPCAITLDPVVTRIDEEVTRRFLADMRLPDGLEVEMPEDDTEEPLGAEIDISSLALEALALAIPPFPRAEAAELTQTGELSQAPKGAAPLTDPTPKPFAALAALKDKLAKDSPPDPDKTE